MYEIPTRPWPVSQRIHADKPTDINPTTDGDVLQQLDYAISTLRGSRASSPLAMHGASITKPGKRIDTLQDISISLETFLLEGSNYDGTGTSRTSTSGTNDSDIVSAISIIISSIFPRMDQSIVSLVAERQVLLNEKSKLTSTGTTRPRDSRSTRVALSKVLDEVRSLGQKHSEFDDTSLPWIFWRDCEGCQRLRTQMETLRLEITESSRLWIVIEGWR